MKIQKESKSERGWLQAPPVVYLEKKEVVRRELEGICYVLCECVEEVFIESTARLSPDKIHGAAREILPAKNNICVEDLLVEIRCQML